MLILLLPKLFFNPVSLYLVSYDLRFIQSPVCCLKNRNGTEFQIIKKLYVCYDTFFCKNEILLCISNISKARNLCVYVCMYVCPSRISRTVHLIYFIPGRWIAGKTSAILMCEVVG